MKNNRPVGPVKPSARMPVAALNNDHLSALAAFERWQRESPHARTSNQAGDSTASTPKTERHRKN